MTASPTIHSLSVPGARLHHEVRGDGPLLLLLGAPPPAAGITALAHALAGDHTVVTTDPRGIARAGTAARCCPTAREYRRHHRDVPP